MTAKAKLTPAEVEAIRAAKAADPGLTNADLARRHGVDASQISRVLNRRSHGGPPPSPPGEARGAQPAAGPLAMIPWRRITPNIRNVRSTAEEAADDGLLDLAVSIKTRGLLQPLRVLPPEKEGGAYVLVDGHRRWRAMEALVLDNSMDPAEPLPCLIAAPAADNVELALDQLAANLARRDMAPLDEAEAFRKLLDAGRSTEAIAAAVGRTRRHVQSRLALARRLAPMAKEGLRDGIITLAQAEALCDGDAGQQAHVLAHLRKFPTEEAIRAFLRPAPAPDDPPPMNTDEGTDKGESPIGVDPCPSVAESVSSPSPPGEARGVQPADERRSPESEAGDPFGLPPIDPPAAGPVPFTPGPAGDTTAAAFPPFRHFRVIETTPGSDNMPATLTLENIITGARAAYERALADIPAFLRRKEP